MGILSLILIFIFYDTAYSRVPAILLGVFFMSIVLTDNLSYFLNKKIFRYFGMISYSVYLLHNIIVFTVFYFINKNYKNIELINNIEYGTIVFIILLLTSIFSMFTYKFIEHKFYKRK